MFRRQSRAGAGRSGAHGVFHGKVKLTPAADGEERRRGGGATERSGDGQRRSARALHDEREGRMRRGTGRGEGGDAPQARNRATAHRRRRIDGEGGARPATAMGDGEGARVWAKGRV